MTTKSRARGVESSQQATQPVEKPKWPLLRPLVPTCDLSLDVVLEDQIILISKLFTSSLCQQYVSFLSTLPLTTTPEVPKKGKALRANDRFQVDDPLFAENIWRSTALKTLVMESDSDWGGIPIGLNPRMRIYRYKQGQFFGKHYDESNLVTCHDDGPVAAKTTWTLLIYLTGPSTGCIGGETCFYPERGQAKAFVNNGKGSVDPIKISPEVGMALLHKHGNDCLLHEGREVTAGEKWIIRSDLCVKR